MISLATFAKKKKTFRGCISSEVGCLCPPRSILSYLYWSRRSTFADYHPRAVNHDDPAFVAVAHSVHKFNSLRIRITTSSHNQHSFFVIICCRLIPSIIGVANNARANFRKKKERALFRARTCLYAIPRMLSPLLCRIQQYQ